MPSPGALAPPRLPVEDTYLELLAATLESLDLPARGQFLQRFLVSAAPVAEQLGDLLSRGWRRRHGGYSTALSLTRPRNFYSGAGSDQKNCKVVAGFSRPFRLRT